MEGYLTPKQKKILDFISRFAESHGYSPSQLEIAQHFGFKSLGTVQHYLVQLSSQGYLQKSWNARRGTRISNTRTSFELPLLGRVAAGRPIEAIQTHETVEVPSFMLKKVGNHFVLQVQGDSMMDEGIMDGDFVI